MDTVYTWESTQQEAFVAIQREITNAHVLAYFDKSRPSIHTVRCIQQWAMSSSSSGWQASHLCIQKPNRDWTLFQHWERTERCICTWVTLSLVYGYIVTIQTYHQHLVSILKKTIASSLPHLQTSLVITVRCEYWILEGKRESHCQCTFQSLTPANHQARWAPERHHSYPHAQNRNSSWFYKCSRIQKGYSRRHNIRPTNPSSHEWLVRFRKGLSSTCTGLLDLEKRLVQRMVYSSRDTD